MLRILLALLMQLGSPHPAITSGAPAAPAFETPQDRLWHRDVSDEANLPTFKEIDRAANATDAMIREQMRHTDASLASLRKVHRAVVGWLPQGGMDITAWYAGQELQKAQLELGGENWGEMASLYFRGGRLIARTAETIGAHQDLASRYHTVAETGKSEAICLEECTLIDAAAEELRNAEIALADPREVVTGEVIDGEWKPTADVGGRLLGGLRRLLGNGL